MTIVMLLFAVCVVLAAFCLGYLVAMRRANRALDKLLEDMRALRGAP